ncbi:MAG: hypothetical protein HOP29_14350 [Phycisphaerales bacterium]|nr:hypothetical protein [Phycisphaerales bacterium]
MCHRCVRISAFIGLIRLSGVANGDSLSGYSPAAPVFNVTRHDVLATGAIQLFDGSPPLFASITNSDPHDSHVYAGAEIEPETYEGSLTTFAGGVSRFDEYRNVPGYFHRRDVLRLQVAVAAVYWPSRPVSSSPGGMAEATVASVIEFSSPSGEVFWSYYFLVNKSPAFNGSYHAVLENVTRGEVVRDFDRPGMPGIPIALVASEGDLLRLTTSMAGDGVAGTRSREQFVSNLSLSFYVPEPTTFALVGLGMLMIVRPARRDAVRR